MVMLPTTNQDRDDDDDKDKDKDKDKDEENRTRGAKVMKALRRGKIDLASRVYPRLARWDEYEKEWVVIAERSRMGWKEILRTKRDREMLSMMGVNDVDASDAGKSSVGALDHARNGSEGSDGDD